MPILIWNSKFRSDLLFLLVGLNCLVVIELNVERFEPEYLRKLLFHLRAIDRETKSSTNSQ